MPPPIRPPVCSELRILRDTEVARGQFRKRRLDDPLADYEKLFPDAKTAADAVVDALHVLLVIPTDRIEFSNLVGKKRTFSTLRSLAATPISADDLQTLLRAKVNKTALKRNQALADSFSALLSSCLDPKRFPWFAENRPATLTELEAAKLATAVLTAVSGVQALRRGDERKALEGQVTALLVASGFQAVTRRPTGIQRLSEAPAPGTFMHAVDFGDHNADFVVGLHDGRVLALECKASNSEVNGYKRLNKEVVVDAKDWYSRFGKANIVAAAALRGVFKPANVAQAQGETDDQRVYVFWEHRLRTLKRFLAAAV